MKSPDPLLVALHAPAGDVLPHRAVCKVIDWKLSVTLGNDCWIVPHV
jgi:hypothetical protein